MRVLLEARLALALYKSFSVRRAGGEALQAGLGEIGGSASLARAGVKPAETFPSLSPATLQRRADNDSCDRFYIA